MMLDMLFQLYVLLIFAIPSTTAFWRLPCTAPLVTERADPIDMPGSVSGHVHSIMGGNGFDFNMTYASTQVSTCTSCYVTTDFSNYWVPTLYYHASNGSFVSVSQNGGALIYYLQRSDPADPEYGAEILAFPEGFRMIAGDQLRRSLNVSDPTNAAITYSCMGTSTAETNGFPLYDCPLGIRAQVYFPSCWDGINLDSNDHRSHVSYPAGYDSGACPASHPKRLVSIFYEVTWNTQDFTTLWPGAANTTQPFVWSSGDPTGFGYHGDFINGWDVPTLQSAINTCTDASGVIEQCPVFAFFNDTMTSGCKIPARVHEDVTGILATLPGCNAIQAGPTNAVQQVNCGATTTLGSPINTYTDLTSTMSYAYLGCGYDPAGDTRTLSNASFTATNMTNAICVQFCKDQGFIYAGSEYAAQCYCGDVLAVDRAPILGLVGDCEMPCSGNSSEFCGGAATLSLYRACGVGVACVNVEYGVGAGDGAGAGNATAVVGNVNGNGNGNGNGTVVVAGV